MRVPGPEEESLATSPQAESPASRDRGPPLALLGGIARVLRGSMVAQAFGFLAGFGIARLLQPAPFGAFVVFATLLLAAPQLHFGFRAAMEKQVPLVAARGEREQGRRLVQGAWAGTLAIGGLAALLCAIAGIAIGGAIGVGLLAGALAIPLRQLMDLRLALCRVREQTRRAERLLATATVAPMAGALLGALSGRAELACGLGVIGLALGVVLTRGAAGDRVRARWRKEPGRVLLRLGLPIYATMALDVALRLLDRGLVGVLLGQEHLGQYGVASTAGWAPWMLCFAASFVQWPRLMKALGRGDDPTPWVMKAGLLNGAVVGLACLALALAGPPGLAWALPAYGPAAASFAAFLPGVLARSICHFPMHLLVAHDNMRPLIAVHGAVLAANLVADVWAIQSGLGIVGVGWATSICLILSGFVVSGLALRWHLPGDNNPLRYALGTCAILLPVLAAAWWAAPLAL